MLIAWLWYGATAFAQTPAEAPSLVLDAGGHTAAVNRVVWTRDNRNLISVSNDKTIRVWDVATGESINEVIASRR